ncbi:bifunctional methylenetetrahydrofolate dehydrogenase/methenyltetrahydrofolate cyclohydrolase FolD [Alicyclobacillus pomorum]|uniref:bifunctional methylenetetrahydrofolate dehydrogenase/methenyltetrahydrofolate cyclohydrolase FolD n=1 Tax=Alicyclobacillus pomorum TaxID=204470 RepID=UPI000553EB38|nr:bifunctional methylenetetrahydrofolate dehydrogenase/methenyltetrahydrofolate cyclohydrolase FolD [Alicyclobacillus pomorum]
MYLVARILDGKKVAESIHQELRERLIRLKERGVSLKLTVVLVGDNPASASYVRGKQRTAEKIGLEGEILRLPADVSQEVLLAEVDRLNADDSVDGILVQLPLPTHIAEQEVLERISPEKDVDGFHPMNAGRNFVGLDAVWPCTPAGIVNMLHREGIEIEGKHAVVVGRSNIVGKPMALLLLKENATVTVCHSRTKNLSDITRLADILVVAVGQPNVVTQGDVKPGAVVIDVGMNRVDGKLVGDVDFAGVSEVASAITPVPGGVGPLTVATLMQNTVALGLARRGIKEE